jgi:hypothetical protein
MRAYLWPVIVVAAAVSAGAGATAQTQPGAATSGSALLAQLPRESAGTNPGGQWQIAERAGYAMDGCALTISVAKWSSPAPGGAVAPLPGYAVQFQARKGLPFRRRLMTDGEKAAFAAKYPKVAGKIYDATVATVDFADVRPSSFKVLDVKLDGDSFLAHADEGFARFTFATRDGALQAEHAMQTLGTECGATDD